MRAIAKLKEPKSLARYRAKADLASPSAYDDLPKKCDIRENLIKEQRSLCAFCGCKIVDDPLKMKIAHWKPRKFKVVNAGGKESFPNLPEQLAYWNMLGVCKGNEGQPLKNQHCDSHQGNMLISRNPANPDHRIEDFISFLPDGSVISSDEQLNFELGCKNTDGGFDEGVLNLNLAFLRTNRKREMDGFKDYLQKRGHLTKKQVSRMLVEWRGDQAGELKPFAPVIAYWLKKRLARES